MAPVSLFLGVSVHPVNVHGLPPIFQSPVHSPGWECRNQVPAGTVKTALGICPFLQPPCSPWFCSSPCFPVSTECGVSDLPLVAGVQRPQLITALLSTPVLPESEAGNHLPASGHVGIWQRTRAAAAVRAVGCFLVSEQRTTKYPVWLNWGQLASSETGGLLILLLDNN